MEVVPLTLIPARGACSAANDVPSPNKGNTWAVSVPKCHSGRAHTESRHGSQEQIVEAILFLLARRRILTRGCMTPTCDLQKDGKTDGGPGRILFPTSQVAPGVRRWVAGSHGVEVEELWK